MTKARAYHVILCAVDGSPASTRAVDLVAALPTRSGESAVVCDGESAVDAGRGGAGSFGRDERALRLTSAHS